MSAYVLQSEQDGERPVGATRRVLDQPGKSTSMAVRQFELKAELDAGHVVRKRNLADARREPWDVVEPDIRDLPLFQGLRKVFTLNEITRAKKFNTPL